MEEILKRASAQRHRGAVLFRKAYVRIVSTVEVLTTTTTILLPRWMADSNTKTRMKIGRKKGKKWRLPTGTQLPGTRKEGEEDDLLFIVVPYRTRLGTVYTSYPWRDNSYSSSTIQERRGRCSGIIIISMVPIGRSIMHLHRTRHTIRVPSHPSQHGTII